jgi:hypothetical protein
MDGITLHRRTERRKEEEKKSYGGRGRQAGRRAVLSSQEQSSALNKRSEEMLPGNKLRGERKTFDMGIGLPKISYWEYAEEENEMESQTIKLWPKVQGSDIESCFAFISRGKPFSLFAIQAACLASLEVHSLYGRPQFPLSMSSFSSCNCIVVSA